MSAATRRTALGAAGRNVARSTHIRTIGGPSGRPGRRRRPRRGARARSEVRDPRADDLAEHPGDARRARPSRTAAGARGPGTPGRPPPGGPARARRPSASARTPGRRGRRWRRRRTGGRCPGIGQHVPVAGRPDFEAGRRIEPVRATEAIRRRLRRRRSRPSGRACGPRAPRARRSGRPRRRARTRPLGDDAMDPRRRAHVVAPVPAHAPVARRVPVT